MLVNDLLKQATEKLRKKGIASAALDAEVLLSYVLQKSREYLYLNPKKVISNNQLKKFKNLLQRRLKFEPVAYLIQNKEFYGLDFYVDQRVLIPRPETELLVEEVIKAIPKSHRVSIIDVGTGSGCIAIALAKHLPKASITAVDISQSTLQIAKKNVRRNKIANRIKFIRSDLLKTIKAPADVIVANPPYLSLKEFKGILKYEPQEALVARRNGKEYFLKLFVQVTQKLNPNGMLFLEIHPSHSDYLKSLAKKHFPESEITVKKDLAKRNRLLIIKKRDSG